MADALYLNGVFEEVFAPILEAQETNGGGAYFLQPYTDRSIALLRDYPPSQDAPVRLYASTTNNLNNVVYSAEITRWEDKRNISGSRKEEVLAQLKRWQEKEVELFLGTGHAGQASVNLITVRSLRRLKNLYASSVLTKTSDGQPLKPRTRAGNWSYVRDVGDLPELPAVLNEDLINGLTAAVAEAAGATDAELDQRLAAAGRLPERIQIISQGFRRNPDVIAKVLRRAGGVCEGCGCEAPFLRRHDGSPYLEVHHRVPLSEGGEDTLQNALALCPNCHRKAHHG